MFVVWQRWVPPSGRIVRNEPVLSVTSPLFWDLRAIHVLFFLTEQSVGYSHFYKGSKNNTECYHYYNTSLVETLAFFLYDITHKTGLYSVFSSFPAGRKREPGCTSQMVISWSPVLIILRFRGFVPGERQNNSRLLWATTWFVDDEVIPPCTMARSGLLSVRPLCWVSLLWLMSFSWYLCPHHRFSRLLPHAVLLSGSHSSLVTCSFFQWNADFF